MNKEKTIKSNLKKYNKLFSKKSKTSIYIYLIIGILIILAIIIKIFYLNVDPTINNKDLAIEKCIALCNIESSKNAISQDGPCLSNEIVAGWSCDIAHNPKVSLYDNQKINQCEKHKHIVEITKKCKLIKAI